MSMTFGGDSDPPAEPTTRRSKANRMSGPIPARMRGRDGMVGFDDSGWAGHVTRKRRSATAAIS